MNERMGDHTCGNVYCKTCKDYYPSEHQCYMLPVDYNDRQKKQTYIFFDFECTQDDMIQCQQGYQPNDNGKCIHCKSPRCGAFEHKPNICVVHRVCLKCMDQDVDKDSICQTCGKNELVFAGPNTTEHFCQWLFSEENEGVTVIAHNFKGYDSLPILRYLYQNGVKPTIIANGAKNMYIEVPGCRIRMIDSINFLPSALSELPKMFGLEELKRGYFPHLFNRKENQSVVLNHLPDVHYYNPDAMKLKDRKVFFVWYETNYRQRFDFQRELLSYCRSDVDILRRAA